MGTSKYDLMFHIFGLQGYVQRWKTLPFWYFAGLHPNLCWFQTLHLYGLCASSSVLTPYLWIFLRKIYFSGNTANLICGENTGLHMWEHTLSYSLSKLLPLSSIQVHRGWTWEFNWTIGQNCHCWYNHCQEMENQGNLLLYSNQKSFWINLFSKKVSQFIYSEKVSKFIFSSKKVSQILCSDLKNPPVGCLQYYTGLTGRVF